MCNCVRLASVKVDRNPTILQTRSKLHQNSKRPLSCLTKGARGANNLFVQYFAMDELMYKESISRQDTPQSHAIVASQTDVSSEDPGGWSCCDV